MLREAFTKLTSANEILKLFSVRVVDEAINHNDVANIKPQFVLLAR